MFSPLLVFKAEVFLEIQLKVAGLADGWLLSSALLFFLVLFFLTWHLCCRDGFDTRPHEHSEQVGAVPVPAEHPQKAGPALSNSRRSPDILGPRTSQDHVCQLSPSWHSAGDNVLSSFQCPPAPRGTGTRCLSPALSCSSVRLCKQPLGKDVL